MNLIYADYNATTPLLNVVKNYLTQGRLDGPFANPNSLHYLGNKISNVIESCRNTIANDLKIDSSKIIFNSGSSESITTTFWMTIGQDLLKSKKRNHLICSTIEHAAVLQAAQYWEKQGAVVHWIKVEKNGIVDISQVKNIIEKYSSQISLVSIMAANNETGVIQPYEQIAQWCRNFNIAYLCDTTQIIGKLPIPEIFKQGVYFCASGHKLGAPLGSGFLVIPHRDTYQPLIMGGEQEKGLRAGTQNYLGIETLTIALNWHYQQFHQWQELAIRKNIFEEQLIQKIPNAQVIAKSSPRLSNTTLISFKGIHSQGMQIELEAKNIFVTTSAACSDNEPHTSKVLRAMGLDDDEGRSVIRISTGLEFLSKNYDILINALDESYKHLNKIHFT